MAETLLSLRGVTKKFTEVEALTEIDLDIHSGEIVGLVGSNGAGKTTLLRLMAGVYSPTTGSVLKVTRTLQLLLEL